MAFRSRRWFFLLILLFSISNVFAGVIKGHVADSRTGEPLAGATVHIRSGSLSMTAVVELDGSFIFKRLPRGVYEMDVRMVGYGVVEGMKETISDDGTVAVENVTLQEQSQELREIQVAAVGKDGDHAARGLEKNSALLQNVLSQRTIELSPDVTVANALQRVSGVAIQRSSSGEGRYAIIRGMDERYNNTLVNGVKIPSPDAKYRYVPMDLFPSDMLERLEVIKSLTPAMEGDAVGGTMNLVMKTAPQHFIFNANLGTGVSTLFSHSRPFSSFGAVNDKSPAGIHGNDYAATQNDFSRSNLNFQSHNHPWYTIAGATVGGRLLHQRLGLILSGSYQNQYRGSNSDLLVPNAQPQVVGGKDNQSVISDLYVRRYSTQTTRVGLHNNIDYVFNDRNRVTLYNMYVHMNEWQTRSTYDSVYLNKISDNLMRSRLTKQSIYSSTLKGEHTLGSQFFVSWTGTYALAKSAVPDMAEYDYQSDTMPGRYKVQGLSRIWQHNTDRDLAGYLNLQYAPTMAGQKVEFAAGGMYRNKKRDNYYNEYSLDPVLVGGLPQYWTNYDDAQYTFNPADKGKGSITTANPNTYTSYEDVSAGYGQFKFAVRKLEVLGGLRIEHTRQHFTTIMPESFPGRYGNVEYTDPLPSLHLKWALDGRQNLRLSYFRSIVRPDFFEIIPTEIVGEVFNIKGNDSLRHSKANNFDLRYELFPGGANQLLLGAFYKVIQDPIEYAIVRNGGPSAQYLMPENFGDAHNYGFEAVYTHYFGKFGITANYTYTHSRITTSKQYAYKDPTLGIATRLADQSRPLQGQADHIGNVAALYKNSVWGLDLQLAFVYTGKRISQVSPYYGLDYWQLGQGVLDFSFEKRFFHRFYFYGKLNNLTNARSTTVIYQSPDATKSFPDQTYKDKTVVGKDVYGLNLLGGIRYKF